MTLEINKINKITAQHLITQGTAITTITEDGYYILVFRVAGSSTSSDRQIKLDPGTGTYTDILSVPASVPYTNLNNTKLLIEKTSAGNVRIAGSASTLVNLMFSIYKLEE